MNKKNESIKITTIKPTDVVFLSSNVSPGIYIYPRFYQKRMQFSADDPFLIAIKESK